MSAADPRIPPNAVTRSDGSMGAYLDSYNGMRVGGVVRTRLPVRGRSYLGVVKAIFWEKPKNKPAYVRIKVKRDGLSTCYYHAAEVWEAL